MKCNVDGCESDAHYKAAQLCQKHYFRVRRNGVTDTVRSRKYRQENPQGYQWVYDPGHPLAHKTSGYVCEHRAVLYGSIGEGPMQCAMCGTGLTWGTCHVDHIDCNVRNNNLDNLRPTCIGCNTRRGRRPEYLSSSNSAIEFDGEIKTAYEWARDPRVKLSGSAILRRKKRGLTDADCLFAEKTTHKCSHA